jgi:plastocyanin
MTDLHPNWQTTDAGGDSAPVRISVHQETIQPPTLSPSISNNQHPTLTQISRQPAAIVGMLLASTIGLSLAFGWSAGSKHQSVTVHITAKGFEPSIIQADADATLTWVNDTSFTHTLQSDQLCTRYQECFITDAIAPGSSTRLALSDAFSTGTYTYYSINQRGLEGSLTITSRRTEAPRTTAQAIPQGNVQPTVPMSKSSAAPIRPQQRSSQAVNMMDPDDTSALDGFSDEENLASLEDEMFEPSEDTRVEDPVDSPEAPSHDQSNLLPLNPNTVGSHRTTQPPSAGTSSAKGGESLHGGAPLRKPITQPSTGPGLWAVITGSAGLLFFGTRKMLRRVDA